MEVGSTRLRLVFDDRGMLSKSQNKYGLMRSWLLLKPHHQTISDVVSYLLRHFELCDSCPNGIILYMDGFVLPPFESTAMLKDGDMIRVKRKEKRLRDVPKAIEGVKTFLEDVIVDKQALPTGLEHLANKEYHRETGDCDCGTGVNKSDCGKSVIPGDNVCNEDVAPKKRKASDGYGNPKAKRQCQRADTVQEKHVHCEPIRTPKEKRKLENGSKQDSPDVMCTKCLKCIEPDANREKTTAVSGAPDGLKKESRNSRRKRLQRKWKAQYAAKEEVDKQCEKELPVKNPNADSVSKKDAGRSIKKQQQIEEDSGGEGDLVPVVIGPGHIRFTSSGKVNGVPSNEELNIQNGPSAQKRSSEGYKVKKSGWIVHSTKKGVWKGQASGKHCSSIQKNQVAKETSWGNGMTAKRKDTKWGKEKQPTSSWTEPRAMLQETSWGNGVTPKRKDMKWGEEKQPTSSWTEPGAYKAQSSGSWTSWKQVPRRVDFEKLVPLIDSPKAGDIVAYRLLELSASSSCPQLSSFRIGKISLYEAESNRIVLVPDPEYPQWKGSHGGPSGLPSESSLYKEDGSLEIDFPSLVDVRIVKLGGPNQSVDTGTAAANGTPSTSGTNKWVNQSQDGSKNVQSNVSNNEQNTPTPANGKRDVWEEISEAMSAKKSQLTPEDCWNMKKASSSTRSWSQRPLRGRALGPPMPRAQNGPPMPRAQNGP